MNELIEAALKRTAQRIINDIIWPDCSYEMPEAVAQVVGVMRRDLIESGVLIPSEEINAR